MNRLTFLRSLLVAPFAAKALLRAAPSPTSQGSKKVAYSRVEYNGYQIETDTFTYIRNHLADQTYLEYPLR